MPLGTASGGLEVPPHFFKLPAASIADCKLATAENMAHIHQHGGRFLTVLPRTRAEDSAFRATVSEGNTRWRAIHDRFDDDGVLIDRFGVHEPESTSAEGYRLIWYHSAHKAELDAPSRHKRVERALVALAELQAKLASPRTRYRDRAKVAEEARCDGVFPLVTNVTAMSALELLLAYKQQPMIEKRLAQLKTDFAVAPVFLKEVSRVQALLCVYFFVLLVEALLERELRRAMEREGVESLPMYPEGRACRRPTARRVIDLFEDVQRHTLTAGKKPPVVFTTELTRVQRKILRLLRMSKAYDR